MLAAVLEAAGQVIASFRPATLRSRILTTWRRRRLWSTARAAVEGTGGVYMEKSKTPTMKTCKVILSAVAMLASGAALARNPNYNEAKVAPYTLEDPLTFADGRKLSGPADWPARRSEILGVFARGMYGREPPPPEAILVELVEEGTTLAGLAIRRQYRIRFRADGSGQVGTVHRLAACPAEQDSGRQGKYRRRARSLRKPGKSPRRADAELPRQPHGSRRRGGPAARGRMAEEVRRAHAGGVRARFPSPLDGPHHGSRRTSRRARVCAAHGKLRAGVSGRRGSRRR